MVFEMGIVIELSICYVNWWTLFRPVVWPRISFNHKEEYRLAISAKMDG